MHFSWNSGPPRVIITADTEDFDPATIQHFRDEGFALAYLQYTGNSKEYKDQLQRLDEPLELGEKYAIVAYGQAAPLVLDACRKPMPKLCAVVAYYPTYLPNAGGGFPSAIRLLVHLAGNQGSRPKYPSFAYKHSEAGFAEEDLEQYDEISARLAWSRTLGCLRQGFEISVDHEPQWEKHLNMKYAIKDVDETLATMTGDAYVNHVPVMTGGIGYKDLRRFYADFFIPENPPSLEIRLISRTLGVDRVVDEMYISFKHTQEVPWMLPGIPPTNKFVEVALASIVALRGGRLYHENVYWDQASVLVQLGLLDPNHIPAAFKAVDQEGAHKVERLPVVGAESARKVLDESSEPSNELISDW